MGNAYGIDIGTSNFKMCCSDKDKILNEKNIIALSLIHISEPTRRS